MTSPGDKATEELRTMFTHLLQVLRPVAGVSLASAEHAGGKTSDVAWAATKMHKNLERILDRRGMPESGRLAVLCALLGTHLDIILENMDGEGPVILDPGGGKAN